MNAAKHLHQHVIVLKPQKKRPDLKHSVLLAERVEERVHGVEHGDHLHGCDMTADTSEAHHIAEQDGHIRKHLVTCRRRQSKLSESSHH